ncbi:competence protein ComK [Peribacillus alkalitolerans]|uniref:competence protein ComK n=1 Tax=Peribacillus alkalitolerans TaxID=1550385 RepID=UPI0013CFA9E8|nr:competence protein ComK [Peribacillus alkalitolerans]
MLNAKYRVEYCINLDTILILPKLDQYGNLISLVLEGVQIYVVNKSPMQIIKDSLLHYGSDFEGARRAAIFHLGNGYSQPVMISSLHNLYWFPHSSPNNIDCGWFALHHIIKHRAVEIYNTEITFTHGHVLTINMKERLFQNRKFLARDLKQKVEEKCQFYLEPKKGLMIVKERLKIEYKEKKDD